MTALRARFITSLYEAAVAHADGDSTTRDARLADADTAFDAAQAVVARRHADLHDGDSGLLVTPNDNATIYDFGYLQRADVLCYWERDRAKARNALLGTDEPVPGCALVVR